MNILVTGGSGFIGTHLIDALIKLGHYVCNVDIADPINPIDIRKPAQLRNVFDIFKPKVVVHLAALASIPLCEKDPKNAYETNVIGTLHVAMNSARHNARLIYASSSAVYGNPNIYPTPEYSPIKPINIYGATKASSEKIVELLVPNHIIFRIFNVYGPRCKRSYVIPDIIKKLRENKNPIKLLGSGREERDFIFIDDAIKAIILSISKEDVRGVYNLGTGKSLTIRELATLIAKLANKPHAEFVFQGRLRIGDFLKNQADIKKIQRDLGWSPSISLVDGIRRTIEDIWLS